MAQVGPTIVTAGANADTGISWTNPGNITTDDATKASVGGIGVGGADVVSKNLVGSTLGFSIPTNAIIIGIEVTVDIGGANAIPIVGLTKNASTLSGNSKQITFSGTVISGSSTDLWGTTWTPAEINSANFGAFVKIGRLNGPPIGTGNVDYMSITVYYKVDETISATVLSATFSTLNVNIKANSIITISSPLSVAFLLSTPIIGSVTNINAGVLSCLFTLNNPSIYTNSNVSISPNVFSLSFSIPGSTIYARRPLGNALMRKTQSRLEFLNITNNRMSIRDNTYGMLEKTDKNMKNNDNSIILKMDDVEIL